MRITHVPENLRSRHIGLVTAMQQDLSSLGLRCELMNTHEALAAARMSVYPDMTDTGWRASLPGDPAPARAVENNDKREVSSLLWPTIKSQIFNRDAEQISSTAVRIGDNIWSGVDLVLAPEEVQPFSAILSRLAETRMPWRV